MKIYYTKNEKSTSELVHYGVKGMRWGIRRTPEQLGHKPSTKNFDELKQLDENVLYDKIDKQIGDAYNGPKYIKNKDYKELVKQRYKLTDKYDIERHKSWRKANDYVDTIIESKLNEASKNKETRKYIKFDRKRNGYNILGKKGDEIYTKIYDEAHKDPTYKKLEQEHNNRASQLLAKYSDEKKKLANKAAEIVLNELGYANSQESRDYIIKALYAMEYF